MDAPPPAMAIPHEIVHSKIAFEHKSKALLHYSSARGKNNDVLIVFLNGLMTDKTSWIPVMANIIRQRKGSANGFPSMLAYDRYGQGMTSDHDPQDEGREQGHGHDCADAAQDLHHLINGYIPQLDTGLDQIEIILVANSIGCAIARLYAQQYPVAAILFLDSIMANSDFDIWPNPDVARIRRPEDLPLDIKDDILREQRAKFLSIFHPSVPNREGLSRRNLAALLPQSDGPMLGDTHDRPSITVVGHDFDVFADESLRTMGTPKGLSMMYSNPIWHAYNEDLAKLTISERSKGPFQAKGCGHFIQRDDPSFVTNETLELVDRVRRLSTVEARTES